METALLARAKQGDDEALRQLFQRYRPLVYSIRNKYFLRDFDDQDWLQEGMITFHDCLQIFELGFGTTLGALFKRSFENRIRSLVRKECAYKRKTNQQTVSFEQTLMQEGPEFLSETTMGRNPLEQLLVQETFEECQHLLSPLEKEAFVAYSLGTPLSVASSERTMQSAYDRSRRKIRNHLLETNKDNTQ